MLYLPPIIPAVKVGRLNRREVASVSSKAGALNYSFPCITRDPTSPGWFWSCDEERRLVGRGRAAYSKLKDLLEEWGQFQLTWALVDSATGTDPGASVCVQSQPLPFLPIWTGCPLEIMYKEETEQRSPLSQQGQRGASHRAVGKTFQYAHGCLSGHYLAGEERFAAVWNKEDGSVWYEITTVSRPAHPLAFALHPFVRYCQRRFVRDSMRAVAEKMREEWA